METTHRIVFQRAQDLGLVPDDSVHLVVTSPPYPMIEMWDEAFAADHAPVGEALGAGNGSAAFELMHQLLDAVWAECARVLAPGCFACINIGDATRTVNGDFRLYPNHARIVMAFERMGFHTLPLVLWRKPTNAPNKFMGSGMLPAGPYVTLEHEYVLIFRKGGKRAFNVDDRLRRRRSAFFWEERNSWFSDMWDFRGTRQALDSPETRTRSAAYPFEVPYRLVNMYSLQEDTVLDPFAGTGTTTLAGMTAGRHTIGVDVDPGLRQPIETRIESSLDELQVRAAARLEDHLAFVNEYTKRPDKTLKYVNEPHNVPVMTKQETALELPVPRTIRKLPADGGPEIGPSWTVTHGTVAPDSPLFSPGLF